MPSFSYYGKNNAGVLVNGQIDAVNLALAKSQLRKQGIRIRKLSKKSNWVSILTRQSIQPMDIMVFSRQLATLVNAGVPLVQSLSTIIKTTTNKPLQNLITSLRNDVQTGVKFSEAITKYPHYFNNLFCSLVRIGEETGCLGKSLDNIANHAEKYQALKRKIKKALFYPAIVIMAAIVVSTILLVKVVPQFETMFMGFHAKLPTFTVWVIQLAHFISAYAMFFLAVLFICSLTFIFCKPYLKAFKPYVDRLVLHLPIFGKLIKQGITARFSATLATTLAAGMPLIDALKIVATTSGNSHYENKILMVRDAVSTGRPMHVSIEENNLFPPLVTQMIAVGEESGKLDEMLGKIADIYQQEVDTLVAGLSSLIEPLVITLVGIVVGGLVVAMYFPIFQLGSVM